MSVTHVPYISAEHRKSILNEMELQLKNSLISKERSLLIAECLDEFERRIVGNSPLHEVGKPSTDVLLLARAACSGLLYFSTSGLIHSDINETNLLITEENNKKKVSAQIV